MTDSSQIRCAITLWPLLLCGLVCCSGAPQSGDPESGVPESGAEARGSNTVEHRLELSPSGPVQAGPAGDGLVRWSTGHVFVLHNQGEHAFPYVLQGSVDWLRVAGPANGVLGSRKRLTIELSIEPKLAPATVGRHSAQLSVLNAVTFHREFSIEVTWSVPVGARTGQ